MRSLRQRFAAGRKGYWHKAFHELIDKEGNVYEMTCVAIKEAAIYSATDKKKEIEDEGDKVVSVVLTRALNDEIEYKEEDSQEE